MPPVYAYRSTTINVAVNGNFGPSWYLCTDPPKLRDYPPWFAPHSLSYHILRPKPSWLGCLWWLRVQYLLKPSVCSWGLPAQPILNHVFFIGSLSYNTPQRRCFLFRDYVYNVSNSSYLQLPSRRSLLPFVPRLAHCGVHEDRVYILFSRARFAEGYRVVHVRRIIEHKCPRYRRVCHECSHLSQK